MSYLRLPSLRISALILGLFLLYGAALSLHTDIHTHSHGSLARTRTLTRHSIRAASYPPLTRAADVFWVFLSPIFFGGKSVMCVPSRSARRILLSAHILPDAGRVE